MQVVVATENVRQGQTLPFLSRPMGRILPVTARASDCTHLQGFHFFLVFVEGAVRVNFNLDRALGFFFSQCFELVSRFAPLEYPVQPRG